MYAFLNLKVTGIVPRENQDAKSPVLIYTERVVAVLLPLRGRRNQTRWTIMAKPNQDSSFRAEGYWVAVTELKVSYHVMGI